MIEVVGLTGEITVPIGEGGTGEVTYVCRGARLSAPARVEGGGELPRHTTVRILRQVGSTLYVAPTDAGGRSEPPAPEEVDAKD